VFSKRLHFEEDYSYFLEGSVQNHDSDIFALPEGFQQLKHGRYFVSDDDNDSYVEPITRKLRLRGVGFA